MSFKQRVIDEKRELDGRLESLLLFLNGRPAGTVTIGDLPIMERHRLFAQSHAMAVYSAILGERIANFP